VTFDPDTAAELRLLRAEIAALRKQVIRKQEAREQPAPHPGRALRRFPPPPPPAPEGHGRHGGRHPRAWWQWPRWWEWRRRFWERYFWQRRWQEHEDRRDAADGGE